MKFMFYSVLVFIFFSVFYNIAIYGQYPPNTKFRTIEPPAGASAPGYLATYDDSTTLTRMLQITHEGDATHSYAKKQPWNIDETKYKIRSIAVYDAETHDFYKTLSGLDIYESLWSNTDPDIIFGFTVAGMIRRYNIETEVLDSLYDLNGAAEIYDEVKLGPGEGNIDIHDKYVALIAHLKNSNDVRIIVFDLELQVVTTTKTFEGMWRDDNWQHQYIDWVSVSQSGNYVGIMWNHNFATEASPFVDQDNVSHYGVEMYNTTNLSYLRRIVNYGTHGDFGFAPDGSEVFSQFHGTGAGSVFSYHLDGSGVDIIHTNSVFTNYGAHLSCRNILRSGWAYLNSENIGDGHGRMIAVKLDGSEIIENFGHSFTTSAVYSTSALPVPNPSGTKIMFKSNFGDNSSADKMCSYEATPIEHIPGKIGQWDFNDANDLTKATIGTDLTSFGTPTAVSGPTAENGAVLLENGDYYSAVTNSIFDSTAGERVNTYTLQMDIKIDAFSGNFASLMQTNINNSGDGDLFVLSDETMGNGEIGYSNAIFNTATWYRMILVVEEHSATNVTIDIYLDGILRYNGTPQNVDNRLSLDTSVLFFCDNNSEEQPTAVSQIILYDYVLTSAEISDLGDAYTEVLPVELILFTAVNNGDAVVLNWETATELNNYGFEIEAKQTSIKENLTDNWSKIGFVPGHGNSNSPKSYIFTTTDDAKYYRLKQVDIDGNFEYSQVVEVERNLSYKLSQNYPNPFNPTTVISFSIPTQTNVKLSVYNMLGEEVAELVNGYISAGYHTVNFDASNLTSGIYIYRISAGNFNGVKKMLLLK